MASPFSNYASRGRTATFGATNVPKLSPAIRQVFSRPLVVNSDYFSVEAAQAVIDAGTADAVSFGRAFLANPDLPERLRIGAPLNTSDWQTWYSRGPEGYTDFPTLETAAA